MAHLAAARLGRAARDLRRQGTGEILKDDEVDARIVAAMRADGADAWWSTPAREFLGNKYEAEKYEKVEDILDVWFDSGSTHAFVLETRPTLTRPADLYFEGSDQHRGWFQSSLLESCATRGRAPYDAVLTHGFVVDENGRKQSKSEGNVVEPQKVMGDPRARIFSASGSAPPTMPTTSASGRRS